MMTAAGETTGQPGETTTRAGLGHPLPAQPTPRRAAPAEAAPEPAVPEQSAAGTSAAGPAAPGPPVPGQPVAGQLFAEPSAPMPVSEQQRAHRVLAGLLD